MKSFLIFLFMFFSFPGLAQSNNDEFNEFANQIAKYAIGETDLTADQIVTSAMENLNFAYEDLSFGNFAYSIEDETPYRWETFDVRGEEIKTKYGIILGEPDLKTVPNGLCSVQFLVQLNGNFRNYRSRNEANKFCNDIHKRTRFQNLCFVRGFGDNFFETNFRLIGSATRRTYHDSFGIINDFFRDNGFHHHHFSFSFLQGGENC